jgi:O-antigen/teichoic acid export membrane protein
VKLAWLAFPLGLALAVNSLWSNIPRYFLNHEFGERELGMFSAVASLMIVGATVIGALGQAAGPKLAKHFAQGDWYSFDKTTLKLISIGGLLGAVGLIIAIMAGSKLLALLYGPEYAAYTNLLCWLMAAFAVQCSFMFCGSAINAMRYFKIHFPIQIVSVLILSSLCFLLISNHGLQGAAYAMLGANIFEAIAFASAMLLIRKECYKQ